jgi:hypothetical protein
MQRRRSADDLSVRPDDDVATLLHQVADQVAVRRQRDRVALEERIAAVAAREERVDRQDARIRELEAALAQAREAAEPPVIDPIAAGKRRRLGKQLVGAGLVPKRVVREALKEQSRTGDRLGRILVGRGELTPTALLQMLAQQDGVPVVGTGDRGIGLLPVELALEHRAVALDVLGASSAASSPSSSAPEVPGAIAVRDLAGAVAVSEALGHVVELRLADAPTLMRLFAQAYGDGAAAVAPVAVGAAVATVAGVAANAPDTPGAPAAPAAHEPPAAPAAVGAARNGSPAGALARA